MQESIATHQYEVISSEAKEKFSSSPDNEMAQKTLQYSSDHIALITGGSRGIGAATAQFLAEYGYDIAFTYHNKAARANTVLSTLTQYRVRGLALPCDLTCSPDIVQFFQQLKCWSKHLDVLILNASGGLERDRLAHDPDYPTHINCDAQLSFIDAALPLLLPGSTIIFVTSHWAHFYGQIKQFPAYEPIAKSKYAGEQAIRARQGEFDARGIRFIVVTGDLIEDTATSTLLERAAPGLLERRRAKIGFLPTVAQMGREIALSVVNTHISSGTTIVVGEAL